MNLEKLEKLLLEGLNSGEATPMTDKDWQDIRQAVREKIAQQNQFKNNGEVRNNKK